MKKIKAFNFEDILCLLAYLLALLGIKLYTIIIYPIQGYITGQLVEKSRNGLDGTVNTTPEFVGFSEAISKGHDIIGIVGITFIITTFIIVQIYKLQNDRFSRKQFYISLVVSIIACIPIIFYLTNLLHYFNFSYYYKLFL